MAISPTASRSKPLPPTPANMESTDLELEHSIFCMAKRDFQRSGGSYLSFRKGDIIEVISMLDPAGWWDGLLRTGLSGDKVERGWFPSDYIDKITDQEAEAALAPKFDLAEDPRIIGLLQLILNSPDREDDLMDLVGDDALYTLNAIQKLLDSSSFASLRLSGAVDPDTVPHRLRRLLLRLVLKCNQLPRALFLPNVELPKDGRHNYSTEGGYSDVYRGLYRSQPVAIKRLRAFQRVEVSKGPAVPPGFYHEVITWHNLSHRHILSFLGTDDKLFPSSFCMVSPWMENGAVRHTIDVMKNDLGISNKELFAHVQNWIRGIVLGLDYLHRENVVHGDLRCANILIDSDMEVRLADFGLSVFADGASNNYGSMRAGATRWLSPELINPQKFGEVSVRPTFMSDIYSFACVLIELYTGKSPFNGSLDHTVIQLVVAGSRPKRPCFHDEALMSDALWFLLERCWSQKPSDRPTAGRLVEELS